MRYFLFNYSFSRGFGAAQSSILLSSNEFPSSTEVKKKVKLSSKDSTDRITITGWTEFKSESDYLAFTSDTSEPEVTLEEWAQANGHSI